MSSSLLLLALLSQLSGEVAVPHALTQPHPGQQGHPAAASGGGVVLTVWPSDGELVAGRMNASGQRLDPFGIRLGAASGSYRPAVAWDGARFWIAWVDTSQLVVQAMDASGNPQGTPTVVKTAPSGTSLRWPALSCNGTQCLLAWWSYQVSTGHQVSLARLDAAGAVVQADLPVSAVASDQHEPAVAWDGAQWLVAWRDIRRADGGDIYATRVSSSGVVLEPGGIPVSVADQTQRAVTLAWNGSHFLLLWQDDRNGASLDQLFAARVASDGTVLDPAGLYISSSSTPGNGLREPALAWNGVEHLVAYGESYVSPGAPSLLFATRLDVNGAVLSDHQRLGLGLDGTYPTVAPSGADWFVAWQDYRNGDADIYAQHLTALGPTPPGGVYLHGMPSSEFAPALSASDAGYLLAWTDYREGSDFLQVRATRLDTAGAALDGTGVLVSPDVSAALRGGTGPAVAFGSGQFLLTYLGGSRLYGVRLGSDGAVVDALPFEIAAGPVAHVRVASNGRDFFVVWEGGTAMVPQVMGARVTELGVVGPRLDLSRSPARARAPTVAWSGQRYLVAWEDWRTGRAVTHGVRVSPQGEPIDCVPLPLGAAAQADQAPVLGGGPAGFLLFSARTGGHFYRRFDAWGVPLDAGPVAFGLTTGVDTFPAAAWNGASYVVAWVHRTSYPSQVREFRAARIGVDGVVLDASPVVLGSSPEEALDSSTHPLVQVLAASTGRGQTALVYSRRTLWGLKFPRHEVHLHGRMLDALPNGASCATADACASGVCLGAACCDRACTGSCPLGACSDAPPVAVDAGWLADAGLACDVPPCAVTDPRDGGCLVRCPEGGCPPADGGPPAEAPGPGPSTGAAHRGGCLCSAAPPGGLLVALLARALLGRRRRERARQA